MEENTEISKSNKIKIIVITALIFLVSIAGISYAYFTIQIIGNETASSMRLRTANMQLVYNDVQIASGEGAIPGWSDTKTLTVTNTGNVSADYIIKFRELENTIINGELVLSATCSASSGTCDALPERAVHAAATEITNAYMYGPISIAPGVTYTYTLTVLFKETGSNQNYNQNKEFYGTLNIGDGSPTDASCFSIVVLTSTTARISNYDTTCGTDVIVPSTLSGKTITSVNFNSKGLTSLVLPNSITSLETNSLQYNNLTSLISPNSVTSIGQNVFRDNQLTSVVIPSSVTSIGASAFYNNHLTSVTIQNGTTTIGQNSFQNNQLTSLVLPNSVTTIGIRAFANNQIASLVIPSSVTSIGNSAFYDNRLTSVTIPSSITTIDVSTFQNNQLTSIIIPSSITSIGNYAFYNNQLPSVTIPSSVTSIGTYAFRGNQLTSVTIPSSVTSINTYAFYQNQLTSVTIEGKSSSSDFTTYGSNLWGWKSGITCTKDNTSNVTNGCITWGA